MASKKLQKYCRIFQWVEVKDKALAEAITDLCLEGALSGGRRRGVTFLYPAAGVRKAIVKKAYSADAEEAIDLLNAHIVQGVVRTAADWRAGVGSRLRIKLEVESASGDAVTLKGGAKLKVAGDFTPLRKDNIAVWEVESGEVPLEGPEYEGPKASRGGRGYRGGDEPSAPPPDLNARQRLAASVENAYDLCQRKDRCASEGPYLTHAVSLLNFLKLNHPSVFVAVLPMIDREPATTFYLLVEPYKTSGSDYVLDDSILFGARGWNGAEVYQRAASEYAEFFESLKAQTAPSAQSRSSGEETVPYAFKGAEYVRSHVDNIRLRINHSKTETPKAIRAAYATLASGNSIDGADPILPDSTLALLPGFKKLWQDELRFLVHLAMEQMRSQPAYSRGEFAAVVDMLRFARPGNDYDKEAQLSHLETLQSNVSPAAEFALLLKFMNSTDFLYIPVSSEKIGGAWGDIPTTAAAYDPADLSVLNNEIAKQRRLAACVASPANAPRGLDAGCVAAIRHYVAATGSLPPELGVAAAPPREEYTAPPS